MLVCTHATGRCMPETGGRNMVRGDTSGAGAVGGYGQPVETTLSVPFRRSVNARSGQPRSLILGQCFIRVVGKDLICWSEVRGVEREIPAAWLQT